MICLRMERRTHARGGCVVLCGGVALHVDSINPILFFLYHSQHEYEANSVKLLFMQQFLLIKNLSDVPQIEHMFITNYEK